MNMVGIITKKKLGQALTPEEIAPAWGARMP